MKKRFLTLLTLMMLAGAMLVGCGGNETGTDNGAGTNTEANVNTEVDVNSGDDTIQIEYGVSNPDATYNETEYCYIVSDAAFVEEKYNDGTEFDRTNWNPVNTMIKLNAPISIYNPFKDIMGYMKTDVTVVYVSVDGEWSYLGFAEEVAKDGLYPNGGTYVRTDELKAVMEEAGDNGSLDNEDSEDSYVTEDIAKIKEAIEAAGLIFDESAFEGEDFSTYENLLSYTDTRNRYGGEVSPDIYGYLINNLPLCMGDEEAMLSSFSDYIKIYAGKSYMIEIISDEDRNYDFNIYIK